ncbi:MAG: hypothetical protein N2512_13645 [Armatimonadetes bacterium]|nr:hypothetical protein [Armatimonadota bacterium]
MRVLLAVSTVVFLTSLASAAGVCTRTVAHDYWVDADTGERLGVASPTEDVPDAAIAQVVSASGCPRRMAIALREVVTEVCDGELVKVLRTYFVGVPVAQDGTAAVKVSAGGKLYFDFRKVQRSLKWDAAAGERVKCWKLGR